MSYQKVGEVLIIKKDNKELAKRLLKRVPHTKTVMCEEGVVKGQKRKPQLKKLAGNGTETVHKEHGCYFALDVSKIMWSKGNLRERKRIAELVKKGEKVVDMFAGIGYFSIPIAVHSKAEKIYSIELNLMAFKYLKKNIKMNEIDNIEPINKDCRDFKMKEKVDRVLMGFLPSSKKYLKKALEFVKKGGTIHYHGVDKKEPRELEKDVQDFGKIIRKTRVKSWAPHRYHWVLDVKLVQKVF